MKRNFKWSASTGAEQASRAERRPGRAAPTSGSGLTRASSGLCSVSGSVVMVTQSVQASTEGTQQLTSVYHLLDVQWWQAVQCSPPPGGYHDMRTVTTGRRVSEPPESGKTSVEIVVWVCVQSCLINIFHWKEFRDFLMLHPLCIDPIHSSTMAMLTYLQVKNNFHT